MLVVLAQCFLDKAKVRTTKFVVLFLESFKMNYFPTAEKCFCAFFDQNT